MYYLGRVMVGIYSPNERNSTKMARGQNMHTKCTRGCEEVAGEDVAQELDEHSTVLVIIEIELSKQTEEIGQPWYCRSENKRAGDAMIRTR